MKEMGGDGEEGKRSTLHYRGDIGKGSGEDASEGQDWLSERVREIQERKGRRMTEGIRKGDDDTAESVETIQYNV